MDLQGIDIDPVPALIGLVIVVIGVRLMIGAVKTMIRLGFVLLIVVGALIFFYGGNLTGA